MFRNDIGLYLAGTATDGGRKTVQIGTLPKASLPRIFVADIQCALGTLQVNRKLAHASGHLSAAQFMRQRKRTRIIGGQMSNMSTAVTQGQCLFLNDGLNQLVTHHRIVFQP